MEEAPKPGHTGEHVAERSNKVLQPVSCHTTLSGGVFPAAVGV
jgi:hypothetical protein